MAIDFSLAKMPYSLEAEQSVLGALLIDPERMPDVADFLTPQDFYVEKNGQIFEIMSRIFVTGGDIDLVTLIDEMKTAGVYNEEESKLYIMQLAEFVPTAANIKRYAQIVWEKSRLRALINASSDIAALCAEGHEDFSLIMEAAERKIYEISAGKRNNEFPSMMSIVSALYAKIGELSRNPNAERGIPTGINSLDRIIGGLNNSDLIILAARPGIGKTSLAMNFAQHAMEKRGKKVAFFSLEMSAEQLVGRLLASVSGVSSKRLMRGDIREDEWDRLAESVDTLCNFNLKIDDNPLVTVGDMKAKLRREKNVDLVIVDYLQLMSSGARNENRVQEVSGITRALKIMAKEMNVPVVVLSQLSRPPEARRESMPVLSDLRESGSIEQDADIVIMLYRDMMAGEGDENFCIAKCRIAKNRHGETGDLDLHWNGELTKFTEHTDREE